MLVIHTKEKQMLIKRALTTHFEKLKKKTEQENKTKQNEVQAISKTALRGLEDK